MAYKPQNFDFQGQVPTSAIIQAYQQKAMQEFQAKQQQEQANSQKHQEVLQTINMASQLVQQGVTLSAKRQQKEAQTAYAGILSAGATPFPTGELNGEVPIMGTRAANDKSWLVQALAAGQKADPQTFQKATADALTKNLFAGQAQGAQLSGRDIQQMYLISPDGKQRKMYNLVETANNGKGALYDSISGQELTQEERTKKASEGWVIGRSEPVIEQGAGGEVFTVDKMTGNRIKTIDTGATSIPKEKYGTVTSINDSSILPVDRKEIVKEIMKIKNDPSITSAKKIMPMLNNVQDYVNLDNKVAVDRLGGLTQKLIALDSGNLSAWEQRDPTSRAYIDRIEQWAKMSKEGKLIKATKDEMIEVLQVTQKNIGENIAASVGMTVDSLTELYPQMNRAALQKMSGVDSLMKYVTKGQGNSLDLGKGWSLEEVK